jgi:hypothetical protein
MIVGVIRLDPQIWDALQARIVDEAQAIRLQKLSELVAQGSQPRLSKRDRDLIDRLSLFQVPTLPTRH